MICDFFQIIHFTLSQAFPLFFKILNWFPKTCSHAYLKEDKSLFTIYKGGKPKGYLTSYTNITSKTPSSLKRVYKCKAFYLVFHATFTNGLQIFLSHIWFLPSLYTFYNISITGNPLRQCNFILWKSHLLKKNHLISFLHVILDFCTLSQVISITGSTYFLCYLTKFHLAHIFPPLEEPSYLIF